MHTIFREEAAPLDLRRTYLAMIRGSIDSRQYQHVFVYRPEGSVDVTDGGNFSCAVYVSSILTLCGLTTGGVHTTVDETIRDMCESGWYPVHALHEGCVVFWGELSICSDGKKHQHIGFSIGNDEAISNHPQLRVPKRHHVTFGEEEGKPVRPIKQIYFNNALRDKSHEY